MKIVALMVLINHVPIPEVGVSVVFKRFLLCNWHFFFDLADLFQLCVVKMLSMLIIEYVIIQIQMEIAFRRIIV